MPKIIVRNFSFGLLLIFILAGCGDSISTGKIGSEDDGEEPAASIQISASPMNIEYGGATEIIWTSNNVDQCVASNDWSGEREVNGSVTFSNLLADKVYTITCDGESGQVQDTVAVKVSDQNMGDEPELTFWASSSQVAMNSPVTLLWESNNTDSCSAGGDWGGTKAVSGSEVIPALIVDSQFILQCEGPSGIVNRTLFVTIGEISQDPPVINLSGTPQTIDYGGSVTLQWNVSDGESCIASGDWSGNKPVQGTETINNLQADGTFTLNCSGPGGLANETIAFVVNDPPVPVLNFTASELTIDYSGSTILQWSSSNADSCEASGDWSGIKAISGSETVTDLQSDSDFSLRCTGAGGVVVDTVAVSVNDPIPEPVLNFTTSQSIVNYDDSITLQWTSTNANSCTADGNWSGSRSSSGTEVISNLREDSVFVLNCTGDGGVVTSSVNVSVNVVSTGTALLQWTAPDENADGSVLDDLVGYRIYYGPTSGLYTDSITINSTGITSYLVENLSPGEWFFVMTAVNSSNMESGYSNEASKAVN